MKKSKSFMLMMKTNLWWSSILYHSVASVNRYLYILVLMLPQLVITCFWTFIPLIFNWFCLLFMANTLSKLKLKKVLIFPTENREEAGYSGHTTIFYGNQGKWGNQCICGGNILTSIICKIIMYIYKTRFILFLT